jgi:hypothetical protein
MHHIMKRFKKGKIMTKSNNHIPIGDLLSEKVPARILSKILYEQYHIEHLPEDKTVDISVDRTHAVYMQVNRFNREVLGEDLTYNTWAFSNESCSKSLVNKTSVRKFVESLGDIHSTKLQEELHKHGYPRIDIMDLRIPDKTVGKDDVITLTNNGCYAFTSTPITTLRDPHDSIGFLQTALDNDIKLIIELLSESYNVTSIPDNKMIDYTSVHELDDKWAYFDTHRIGGDSSYVVVAGNSTVPLTQRPVQQYLMMNKKLKSLEGFSAWRNGDENRIWIKSSLAKYKLANIHQVISDDGYYVYQATHQANHSTVQPSRSEIAIFPPFTVFTNEEDFFEFRLSNNI